MKKTTSALLLILLGFSMALELQAQCPVSILPSGPLTVCSGTSVTFYATPDPSYSYQWYRNNVLLSFATADTFTTPTHGTYYCVVTSGACTSTSASLTISISNNITPTISHDTPLAFCPPGYVVLNANNDPGISYQWENNSVAIPGATASSYMATGPGLYRALETLNGCSKYTPKKAVSAATTVKAEITSDILSISCLGSTVHFNVTNAIPGYLYQWIRDEVNIAGANNSTYSTTVPGTYLCIVTASCGTDTSNAIKITEETIDATLSPAGPVEICSGTSTTLSVPAGAGYTYTWYRNNLLLPGNTADTFTTPTHGFYYCVIQNGNCTAPSNVVEVKVLNNTTPVISSSTPLSFCPPGYVVLTANSEPGISYQWELNSVPIAGATSITYTATVPGLYRALESVGSCSKYTPKAGVSLATGVNAAITASATSVSCSGPDVVLTFTDAIPGYGYQWMLNGIPIIGATDTVYTTSVAGDYRCAVTASCGSDTSALITLLPGELEAEVSPSGTLDICIGSSILLSASTGLDYTYQWQLNNVDIPGALASTYTASSPGSYSVTITSPCGTGTSAVTVINYGTITAAVSPAGISTVCSGLTQTFTASTGSGYSYAWFRNNQPLNITTSSLTTPTQGTYKVIITLNGTCSETSNSVALQVVNNPTPFMTASGPQSFCIGDSVVFTANSFPGVSYQWQNNSIDIIGETASTYTATTAGTFRVKETANGCYRFTPKRKVVINPCRENSTTVSLLAENTDEISESLSVFPNPFESKMNIRINSFTEDPVEIKVLNVLGKEQFHQLIRANSDVTLELPLAAGIYIITGIVDGETKVVRAIKTR